MSTTALTVLGIAISLGLYIYKHYSDFAAKKYPPGPKPLPFIGNLLDLPPDYQWKTYGAWKETYGDLISITMFGQRIVVINSLAVANDLLDKKGAIYSDRPRLPMVGKLLGWAQNLVLTPYGDSFRNQRRFLHRHLGSRNQFEKVDPWRDMIESETRLFLRRMAQSPQDIIEHAHKLTGSIVLDIGYGYKIKEGKDPLVSLVKRALDGFVAASIPGSYLVDILPAMEHIPSWFPGAKWKRDAEQWRSEFEQMNDVPYDMAKDEAKHGRGGENFVRLDVPLIKTPQDEHDLKNAIASLYAGGADTVVSAVMTFILTMVLNPDAQKKAQQEIDMQIGTERLPSSTDYDSLPYVKGLVYEVYRFHPVAPLGIPHRVMQDDYYNGYLIPAGSTMIVNGWQICQDPSLYPEPEKFKPERFMGDHPDRDIRDVVFGFGRRVCPGINLAEVSFFTIVSNILATYDITRAVDTSGKEIIPTVEYTPGTTSHPKPFPFVMKPRSEKHVALMETGRLSD